MTDINDRLERLNRRDELARRARQRAVPLSVADVGEDFLEIIDAVSQVVRRYPGMSIMLAPADGRPTSAVIRVSEHRGEAEVATVTTAGPPANPGQTGPAGTPAVPYSEDSLGTPAGAEHAFGTGRAAAPGAGSTVSGTVLVDRGADRGTSGTARAAEPPSPTPGPEPLRSRRWSQPDQVPVPRTAAAAERFNQLAPGADRLARSADRGDGGDQDGRPTAAGTGSDLDPWGWDG